MLVTFDFIPEEDEGVALVYAGTYKYRHGNCYLSMDSMATILKDNGLSVDFKAGRYLYRTEVLEGAIVTPPQMVLLSYTYFDGCESYLTDGYPVPEQTPVVIGLGGRFEVDAPLTVVHRHRRFSMSTVEDASLLERSITFLSPKKASVPDLPLSVAIPEWFHKFATVCGAYPHLPVKWIPQTRNKLCR